jgi:hypothetical protein
LVFVVQEVQPCTTPVAFGGVKKCFQAAHRVLCKKRSVGVLQMLLFKPAPAQPEEMEKTSTPCILLGVAVAVLVLGLAASLSTADTQVSFVSAFLAFWLLCAYAAHTALRYLTTSFGIGSAAARKINVSLFFFFAYLALCFLLAKITLFFFTGFSTLVFRQLALLYLISVFCYLGISSREGMRSLLHPKDRYLATWSIFWFLKYLCVSLCAVVCFNSGQLLGLLIPYAWAVVLALPYCRSLFFSCVRDGTLANASPTSAVGVFYSKHLVSISLCALVNLSYCLFYSNTLSALSLSFYVALVAFYLRSPAVNERLRLLGSLFVCSVTTVCLLASVGFDFDVLPGEFFLVTKNELCGVYIVL